MHSERDIKKDFEIDESVVEQFDVSSMQRTKIMNTMSSAMPTNLATDPSGNLQLFSTNFNDADSDALV